MKDVSFVTTILDVVRTFQFKILRSDVGTAGQVDAVRVHVFRIRVCAVHHQLLKFSTVGLIAETDEPTVTSDITVNGDATREPIEGAVFTNVHRTTDRGHGIAVFVELPGGTDRNLASSRDVDAAFRNEGVQSGRFTKGYGTLTVDEDRMGTLTDRAYGNGSTVHGNVMTIQRVNAVLKVSGPVSIDAVNFIITLRRLQRLAHRKVLSVDVGGKGVVLPGGNVGLIEFQILKSLLFGTEGNTTVVSDDCGDFVFFFSVENKAVKAFERDQILGIFQTADNGTAIIFRVSTIDLKGQIPGPLYLIHARTENNGGRIFNDHDRVLIGRAELLIELLKFLCRVNRRIVLNCD